MKRIVWVLGIVLLLMPVLVFAQKVTLEFVVWNYSLETIQDNIAQFQQANPNIKVNLKDYSWNTYHDVMVLRFKGKTKTDIMYNGEDWLPEFAAAGWVASLEDYFPEVKKYKEKTAGYALADMTYKGKLYGLSYYADLITFQYNKRLLKDFGVAAPKTWEDVWSGMEKAAGAGIAEPFAYEYDATLPNMWSAFVSQVYGRGGKMFDAKLNPVFNDPKSEAFKQLQWLQDAKKQGYIAYYNHESKVAIGMNTGNHVYTVMYNYMLNEMSKPGNPLEGEFDMVEMPGAAHGALGFAKFYCMTMQAAKDPVRRNASWKFIEAFGGGDYKVAKRWAVEKGLGFAALPLFDDPDVKTAWGSWIDMAKFKSQAKLAKNDVQTEWKGMWSQFFRPLLAKAINGDATVKEVMDQGAAEWNNYKSLMGM
jgi:multiple sugar transport system substrate-binding protein